MQINGSQPADALRLVHPPGGVSSPANVAAPAAKPAGAAENPYRFEAVYAQQLPRVTMTEAHRRVEQIRDQFVAGRTDVPIHFEQPGPASTNPYANPYMKLAPAPADANMRATEAIDFTAE